MSRIVAVPCDGPQGLEARVSAHFGHATHFALVTLEEGAVVGARSVEVPSAGACACSKPEFVGGLGAGAVVVGGLGPGAFAMLGRLGLEVATGARGSVREAVEAYAKGALASGAPTCAGHGHHHG